MRYAVQSQNLVVNAATDFVRLTHAMQNQFTRELSEFGEVDCVSGHMVLSAREVVGGSKSWG